MTEHHYHNWIHVAGVGAICSEKGCDAVNNHGTWKLNIDPNHEHVHFALPNHPTPRRPTDE